MVRMLVIALVLVLAASALEFHVILDQRARIRACEMTVSRLAAPDLGGRYDELIRAGRWLHEYYASDKGLRRPGGLVQNGEPDFEGIAAWLVDHYLRRRIEGASEAAARIAVIEEIEQSTAWQEVHRPRRP